MGISIHLYGNELWFLQDLVLEFVLFCFVLHLKNVLALLFLTPFSSGCEEFSLVLVIAVGLVFLLDVGM